MTLNTPDDSDLQTLRELAGGQSREGSDMASYLLEPRDLFRGQASLVLRPGSTEEVAAIVSYCNERRIGIIPYGGGTGLVGGQLSGDDPAPIVLSLERMDQIRAVVPEENAMIVEAGVILQDAQEAADAANRLFPLSLAAQGSARIGGNLSTNAGGVQVLRYGNARDLCLGIEAVMPNGEILHGLKTLRKDNTGYDLRHLLTGAEGTLGVITAAALKLFPKPGEQVTAMLAVPSPAAAVGLLRMMQDWLGDTVTAFELIKGQGIEFLDKVLPGFTDPLPERPEWRVLTEISGGGKTGLEHRTQDALEAAFDAGFVTNGAVASSEGQRANMWNIREHLPEANRRVGSVSSHDISLPIGQVAGFLERADGVVRNIDSAFRINCFGHMGDGNLHYNVFPPEGRAHRDYDNLRKTVRQAVHDLVAEMDGSVSAEHGIGRLKTADLVRYGDPTKVATMRAIKAALDPNGIMNPGAVLT